MECGINGKVMQRLEEARAKQERRIQEAGVTGEVIHEKNSLQRGRQQRAGRQEMDRVMERRWKYRVCERRRTSHVWNMQEITFMDLLQQYLQFMSPI